MTKSEQEVENFKRNMLKERLDQITEEQRQLFHRLFPKVTSAKLMTAIDLCDRAIKKNQEGRPPRQV